MSLTVGKISPQAVSIAASGDRAASSHSKMRRVSLALTLFYICSRQLAASISAPQIMSNPHDGDDHLFSGDLNLVGDRILSSSDTARHHQQASFSFPRDNITNTPSWLLQTPTIAVQSQPAEELQDWVLAMNPETGTRASTGAAAHSSHPGTNPIISSNFDVNARGQLQQYSSGLEQHFSFGLNPGMSQQSPNSSLIAGRRDPGNNESVSHVLPPTLYSAQTGTMENLNNTLLASGPILDADLSARATLVTSSSGWPRGQTNFVQAPPIGAVVGAQLVGPTNGLMPMSRYEMEPTGPGFEQLDYGQYLPPPGNQPLSFAAGLRNQVTRAAQAAPPGLSNPRYTADPFDPMSLLNADHLKDFPYVATPEVANEASRPDIVVADDADEEGPALPARGAQGTTGLRRLGKKVS